MSTLVTEQEMERRRKLKDARVKAADRLNCAVGWIGPDLKPFVPDPPRLPKRPKEGKE